MRKRDPKDRLARAIEQAAKSLTPRWEVSILKNHAFHLEAVRPKEVIRIRVVLDKATEKDRAAVALPKLPDNFTREIWIKSHGQKGFETIEL